ncbi:MAG: DUF4279 domain-containing protein [Janthinobacterium lividum]
MSEKNKTTASAMLMILGCELDPDKVTEALGLIPSQAWRKGENKKYTRADNTIALFDSIHEWGGWKLWASEELKQLPLESQLNHWLQVLMERAAEIKKLKEQGNEIIVSCFLATKSYLVYLPSEIQAQFVDLGIDLEISISGSLPTARQRRRILRRR